MKTIEGENNKLPKGLQGPPMKDVNDINGHAEKEDEMDEWDRVRQRVCLSNLEGFLAGRWDEFFQEVDWPLENEASAEKFLSDAGVPKDVKKAFVLISPRQEEPNWKVSYILLKRNGNLSEKEIEKILEERERLISSSRRMFKIIMR